MRGWVVRGERKRLGELEATLEKSRQSRGNPRINLQPFPKLMSARAFRAKKSENAEIQNVGF